MTAWPIPNPAPAVVRFRPSRMTSADAVIVNYNAGMLLLQAVASAFNAGIRRVVVVDNASRDQSLALIHRAFNSELAGGRLIVRRNAKNLGFAAACNIGARCSDAAMILFLNPDAVLNSDALLVMQRQLLANDQIGLVGGFLTNPDGSEQRGGRCYLPTPWRAFTHGFGLARATRAVARRWPDRAWGQKLAAFCAGHEMTHLPPPTAPVAMELISGSCMLVRHSALKNVGYWDEGYFLYAEDYDLCARFAALGWLIYFCPAAKITHRRSSTTSRRPFLVAWHLHKGLLRYYRKFWLLRPGWLGLGCVLFPVVAAGIFLRFSGKVVFALASMLRLRMA